MLKHYFDPDMVQVNLDKGIVWDMLHSIDEYHSSVEALNIDCISAGPNDERRLYQLERCLTRKITKHKIINLV